MVKPHSLSRKSKTPAGPRARGRGKPSAASAPKGRGRKAAAPATPPSEGGDTERRILAAARKEFIAKGLDGARMQSVATQAGVNKALLHYYFRSKEKLYQKVLEDTLETVWAKLAGEFRSRSADAGLEPLLRTVVTTYVRTLAANPEFPLFMFREMASGGAAFREGIPELMRRFQDVPAAIAGALKDETAAGKIKRTPPVHFFMNMMGMTVATFLLMPMIQKLGPAFGVKIDFGEAFLEDRIQSITDTLLHGIRLKR
jgi:AcrR family transcriptional regulator